MAVQLVQLPEIQRLSPLVIRVLGGNPGKFTLQGTNTYLVGKGSARILIDTGEGRSSWINALQAVLKQQNVTIDKVILTHWHHDHVGGIKHLRESYPHVAIHKHLPDEGQTDIKDGQRFSVDGATLRAAFSPGHTQDHMAFVLEEEDAMFTGDNVLGQGTAVFEDLGTYLRSLKIMKGLCAGRAYPGHGPVIDDGKAKIDEYIQHRQEREDQVVRVLSMRKAEAGPTESHGWTSMEIVKYVYKDVPENLHFAANGGILQVLEKLEREGKVIVEESQRWSLKHKAGL